jgi:hypothetical protein
MSFLNKLWKNLRADHKSGGAADGLNMSSSNCNKKSASSSSSGKSPHHFHGSSIEHPDYNNHPHHQQQENYARSNSSGHQQQHPAHHRKSSTLNFRIKRSDRNDRNQNNYDMENIAPSSSSNKKRSQSKYDPTGGLTDDSGFELDTSSEEFQLPPGILSDLAKHPTVSRHLSVSRSGRYKHRNKMRSNLFDVVKRDGDEGEDHAAADSENRPNENQEKHNDSSSNNKVKSEPSQKSCDAATTPSSPSNCYGNGTTRHRRDSNYRRSSSSGMLQQQQPQEAVDPHKDAGASSAARYERRSRKGGTSAITGTSTDVEVHAVDVSRQQHKQHQNQHQHEYNNSHAYPVSSSAGMTKHHENNDVIDTVTGDRDPHSSSGYRRETSVSSSHQQQQQIQQQSYPGINRNNRSHYDHQQQQQKYGQRTMPIPIATPKLPLQHSSSSSAFPVTGMQHQQPVYQRHASSHDHDHNNSSSSNSSNHINRNGVSITSAGHHHRDLRASNSRMIDAIPVRHACS